eukprot:TRINITY_DN4539_c0_g1_i5.p2 TRINITY_DN4539_c0_g1~~TRINITY_DN4539_c0_g1_i5.p2  ORF type:complete len:167 (+),score=25.71 TRINITY_DN4539_c0_g1_i5:297-797(+)
MPPPPQPAPSTESTPVLVVPSPFLPLMSQTVPGSAVQTSSPSSPMPKYASRSPRVSNLGRFVPHQHLLGGGATQQVSSLPGSPTAARTAAGFGIFPVTSPGSPAVAANNSSQHSEEAAGLLRLSPPPTTVEGLDTNYYLHNMLHDEGISDFYDDVEPLQELALMHD